MIAVRAGYEQGKLPRQMSKSILIRIGDKDCCPLREPLLRHLMPSALKQRKLVQYEKRQCASDPYFDRSEGIGFGCGRESSDGRLHFQRDRDRSRVVSGSIWERLGTIGAEATAILAAVNASGE